MTRRTGHDLPRASWALLEHLAARGAMRVSDVAACHGVDVSTITPRIQRLEGEGLVSRGRLPTDGRASIIAITPQGHVALERVHAARRQLLEHAVGDADGAELGAAADVIARLAEHLGDEPMSPPETTDVALDPEEPARAEPPAGGDDSAAPGFRAAMSQAAGAVAVVTTVAAGEPHGTTVSAFISLSMAPPMLLVSLANGSRLLARLRPGSVIGLNVLSAPQAELAARFAGKAAHKFEGTDWELADGAPRLAGHHAWATATITEFVTAGDHTLVLGAVTTADVAANRPLVHWRHTFGTHAAL